MADGEIIYSGLYVDRNNNLIMDKTFSEQVTNLTESVFNPSNSTTAQRQEICDAINAALGDSLNRPLTLKDFGNINNSAQSLILEALEEAYPNEPDKLNAFLKQVEEQFPNLSEDSPLRNYNSGANYNLQVVVIKHEIDGEIVYSRYFHLDGVTLNAGDMVQAGQQIGTIGDYGLQKYYDQSGQEADHLHFDIMKDSESFYIPLSPPHDRAKSQTGNLVDFLFSDELTEEQRAAAFEAIKSTLQEHGVSISDSAFQNPDKLTSRLSAAIFDAYKDQQLPDRPFPEGPCKMDAFLIDLQSNIDTENPIYSFQNLAIDPLIIESHWPGENQGELSLYYEPTEFLQQHNASVLLEPINYHQANEIPDIMADVPGFDEVSSHHSNHMDREMVIRNKPPVQHRHF